MQTVRWNIELQKLTLGYDKTVVLHDITATLPAGKISVVLGGSGCGKSTLLRHIIGLSRPMSGTVLLGGHDFFALSPSQFRRLRRRMGVLFQDGALLGSLTVAENTGLALKEHTPLPAKVIREIVLHKLALVGLADFADYYPSELSGGMRKRAGLARALITDPPLLLCDEPTSGLDPISAAQMDELLLDMKAHAPDMTIVCVTHDMASVSSIADTVLVLHNKTVAYAGDLAGLQQSSDPYLRQFIERKTMREAQGQDPRKILDEKIRKQMHTHLDSWLDKA